jgi:hypothetical protein
VGESRGVAEGVHPEFEGHVRHYSTVMTILPRVPAPNAAKAASACSKG